MNFSIKNLSAILRKIKHKASLRQFCLIVGLLTVGACAGAEQRKPVAAEVFWGGVAADEPRAALVGRDILLAGGSAADAAAAVYFALSVTSPSSASLGGGGVCVVYGGRQDVRNEIISKPDADDAATVRVLDFLPRAPANSPAGLERPMAIPGNVRGFFALHAEYGDLRWPQLVAPAEQMAGFGIQMPQGLAQELTIIDPALRSAPNMRRIFQARNAERPLGENEFLAQTDLASVLGRIRAKGPGEFYGGALAREISNGAMAAGGYLTVEDLRNFRPVWLETVKVPFGNLVAHFTPPPAAAGTVAAQMWAMLVDGDRFADAKKPDQRLHLLAQTSMRAFADRRAWQSPGGTFAASSSLPVAQDHITRLMDNYRPDKHFPANQLQPRPAVTPENPSATSFAVVDSKGQAVACTLTMNSLFGVERIAQGTGIVLAAAPGKDERGLLSLGPMMVINHNVDEFRMASASSGGVTAPTSMISVAARRLLAGEPLKKAIGAYRVHHSAAPDMLYYEEGLDADLLRSLKERGYSAAASPVLGLVNMISCSKGLPPYPSSCSAWADPRGFGLAAASMGE